MVDGLEWCSILDLSMSDCVLALACSSVRAMYSPRSIRLALRIVSVETRTDHCRVPVVHFHSSILFMMRIVAPW